MDAMIPLILRNNLPREIQDLPAYIVWKILLSHSYVDNLVDDFSSISALAIFLGNSSLTRKEWSQKAASEITDSSVTSYPGKIGWA